MLYEALRTLLFQLDAEKSHHLGMRGIQALNSLKLSSKLYPVPEVAPVEVMGITFPNRVGLAAGLDKNGDYLSALSALGFGFVEVGTVTPRSQPGNPKPRLFRLAEAEAIINRMGFNNLGADHLVAQVKAAHVDAVVGINIGKNIDTAVEDAVADYLMGLEKVYQQADYIAINISSPNTPGLRKLQFGESLKALLGALKDKQTVLHQENNRYVPMAVKVAPDLDADEVEELASAFTQYEIDAVIATNTTMARDKVAGLKHAEQAGGLSGRPVFEQSTDIVRQFRAALPDAVPIIAAGGIMSGQDAIKKLEAGASLVQIYSGFIYQGPALIAEIINSIEQDN
jgi:dihydroorotate dehydrogenase